MLIVDDDYYGAFALECLFEQFQLECDLALNGAKAMEMISARYDCDKTTYSLIMMDQVMMNSLSGIET